MQATLSPNNIRSLLPIYIDITGTTSAKIQIVPTEPQSPLQPFFVETAPLDSHLRGTFWIEHPGNYEAQIKSGSEQIRLPFHVAEQKFLNFSIEFGFFMLTLAIAAGGLILWYKKKRA
ncbi:MAG: hypothetical protein IPJ69_11405 [Deltaproteobacteria bacterium]|nr:MAG: hypothetical protein IPJ69_11405 [Deltaproteobacteria bacterium]